jgi:hypothetical protein
VEWSVGKPCYRAASSQLNSSSYDSTGRCTKGNRGIIMHEKGSTRTRIMGVVILSAYALFLAYAVLAIMGVSFVRY